MFYYVILQASHGWTSMQGRVVFWYRLLYQGDGGFVRGEVLFKLYGQKCDRCNSSVRTIPETIDPRLYNHPK